MCYDDDPPEPLGAVDDQRLRLIFTCCHPALAMQTRVALTLRMVGGLTMPEIARAFLNARRVHTWVESQKGAPRPVEVTRKGAPVGRRHYQSS
jgi:hypothetical protein